MPETMKAPVGEQAIVESPTSVPPYKLLDMWRGVASLLVVIYHASLVFMTLYPVLRLNPIYGFGQYGYLGVRIFFVISGYCIAHAACANFRRDQGVRAFVRARFKRIYPPVWCAQAIYAVLSLVAAALVARGILKSSLMMQNGVLHRPPLYFVGNITLLAFPLRQVLIVGPTWTLCYEVAFYLMVAIALAIAYKHKKTGERVLLNGLHALTVFGLCVLMVAPQSALCAYPLDFWPQFGLGIAAYDILHNRRRRSVQAICLLIALLVICVAVLHDVTLTMLTSSRESYLFSLAFTVLIIVMYPYDATLNRHKIVKIGGAIGLFSYSLYLTHTIFLGLETQVLTKLKIAAHWHLLMFPLLVLVSIGFARLFFQYCEKPFLNARKREKGRNYATGVPTMGEER